MGLDDPCFGDSDEVLLRELFEHSPVPLEQLREHGWAKIDLGQGPTPHADGAFVTESGKLELSARYVPSAEVADESLAARHPLSLITPKTHLFLNSTFPNQAPQHSAQPEPFIVISPADAGSRSIADGDRVRVFNDRGDFVVSAHVSDDARPGVLVAPMGWWNADYPEQRSSQATTPQRLTEIGAAPTFNDNRVEIEAIRPAS